MYWIHSPNDFAVFVYHFTCKTVFVPLGAKISEPYLPHQHFTRAQFAGPDLPGAQFAAKNRHLQHTGKVKIYIG